MFTCIFIVINKSVLDKWPWPAEMNDKIEDKVDYQIFSKEYQPDRSGNYTDCTNNICTCTDYQRHDFDLWNIA